MGDVAVRVNGEDAKVPCPPGAWASVKRAWNSGDRVEITIPQSFRMQAVDAQHPDRVAIVRGPVAMVLETDYHEPKFRPAGHGCGIKPVARPWRKSRLVLRAITG